MFSLCKLMCLKVQPLDWAKVIGASTGDLESPASRWPPNTKAKYQILIYAVLLQANFVKNLLMTWNGQMCHGIRQVPMRFEAAVRCFKARGASQPAASNALPAQGWGEWHLQVKRNLQTFASTLIPIKKQNLNTLQATNTNEYKFRERAFALTFTPQATWHLSLPNRCQSGVC